MGHLRSLTRNHRLDRTFLKNCSNSLRLSQIDFGHRAVHLSTTYAKAIAKQYYGQKSKYNYWIGCSSGGKQGMHLDTNMQTYEICAIGVKSAQMYPEDFDGVIAGARTSYRVP